MIRRLAASLLLPLSLAAIVAGPVLAKDGMQARLDAPIPADAPPGTTIEVGWTTFQADEAGGRIAAFSGAPVSIALTPPGATQPATVVLGEESPSGSGHYTASVVVPDGGIAPDGVTIALRGESCENGVCQRSDLAFQLVGAVLTGVAAPPASAVVPPASTAPDPASMASDPAPTAGSSPVLVIALAAAIVVGLGAVLVGRRRRSAGDAAAQTG
jgi:hypothetical protein